MEVFSVGKYIRISPYKAHGVAKLIRGKPVVDAQGVLTLTPKKAARLIKKVLDSAVANAKDRYDTEPDQLYVRSARVDKGPTLKRIKPRARGRADRIYKRYSRITIVLEDRG
jgi:large subunit ribosomal protein L22